MAQTPRFERESFFQAQAPDDSSARVASGLASALSQFSNVALSVGQVAGQMIKADKKKQADLDKIQVGMAATDIGESIRFAQGLYPDDIEAFNTFVTGSMKGTTSAMPENLRLPTMQKADAAYKSALTEVKLAWHENNLATGVIASTDIQTEATINAANAARSGNAQSLAEQKQLFNDALSPQLFTPEEIKTKTAAFDKEMGEQAVVGKAITIADTKGLAAAFDEIQAFEEKGVKGVHPDEVTRTANLARGVLDGRIASENKQNALNDKNTKKAQQQNYQALMIEATDSAISPLITTTTLGLAREALRKGNIDPKQFLQIKATLDAPTGIDNLLSIEDIKNNVFANNEKGIVNDEIGFQRSLGNLTADTASDLYKLNNTRSGLPQTPFELEAKQQRDSIKLNVAGTLDITGLDFVKAQRLSGAMNEYDQRILTAQEDGLTPSQISQDIIPRFLLNEREIASFAKPRFGNRDSVAGLQEAKFSAIEANASGSLSDAALAREIDLINKLLPLIKESNSKIGGDR